MSVLTAPGTAVQGLDRWIHGGDTTRRSLARYRVLYAVVALLLAQDFHWVSAFPAAMYDPPPGLMRIFPEMPPVGVLRGLELARTVLLVAVLVGLWTRVASFALVVVSIVGFGFTYSLGKIDHTILLLVAPAALALAGWGDRASVDARRRALRGGSLPPDRAEQWPLRLFALMIGIAFLTAAVPKVLAGWLDPRSHAVQATQQIYYYVNGVSGGFAPFFVHLRSGAFWELLDVSTVVLEAGLVLAVLTWRGTRVAFAVAALFHLGVLLMLDISFVTNVVVYGFVVQWDRLRLPWAPREVPARLVAAAPLLVPVVGAALFTVSSRGSGAHVVVEPLVVGAGALVGAGYLVWLARGLASRARH